MINYRLADKAAMRILAISKAIRGGVGRLPPPGPTVEEVTPPEIRGAQAQPAPVADTAGVAPLEGSGADMGIIAGGGDTFDALTANLGGTQQ